MVQFPEHISILKYFIENSKTQTSSSGLLGADGVVRTMGHEQRTETKQNLRHRWASVNTL